jgi:hypothetical protein
MYDNSFVVIVMFVLSTIYHRLVCGYSHKCRAECQWFWILLVGLLDKY